jgi:hypothetical protein
MKKIMIIDADDRMLEYLTKGDPDFVGPRLPLMKGEVGTINSGFRFVTSTPVPPSKEQAADALKRILQDQLARSHFRLSKRHRRLR